ncbi:hypothetical protein Syun_019017 [Stephania yunnanensis]|uniref:Uncharacterized protein n=1 Tax=Stephania yunnanensis TaxID=152371 RepID=A0AAP0ITZ6_9MAGN
MTKDGPVNPNLELFDVTIAVTFDLVTPPVNAIAASVDPLNPRTPVDVTVVLVDTLPSITPPNMDGLTRFDIKGSSSMVIRAFTTLIPSKNHSIHQEIRMTKHTLALYKRYRD